MGACGACGGRVERQFRFCPWCSAPLRRKLTEFFLGDGGRALRVSRYLVEDERQVRFSVWSEEGVAEAVVALSDEEADRLADFVVQTSVRPATRSEAESTPRA
jgi:hypothetical protein